MLKVYLTVLSAIWKKFGVSPLLFTWGVLPLFRSFSQFTLFLDGVFFPGYRHQKINHPVFILGCPRSGTTFLHLLLTQTREFPSFETWQLIFPSLTARVLFKPLINYLANNNLGTIMGEKSGHKMSLTKIEHDAFLFIHRLDTLGRGISSFVFEDGNQAKIPELEIPDRQPKYFRQSSMKFFKGCLQRQIYYTGKKQILAHAHSSIFQIKTFLEAFPDAKFIYLVRSPYQTIPSLISFMLSKDPNFSRNSKKRGKDLDFSSGFEQKVVKRGYQEALDLYNYFYTLEKNEEIPSDSYLILSYDELRYDLDRAAEKIFAFTGIKPSEQLREAIENQSKLQKDYKRTHKNFTLQDLGITKDQITKDFSFVFEHYGFEKHIEKAQISVS